MAFIGFLAGAALGGLAGYTLGAWPYPWYWRPYYAPNYYYQTPSYPPYYPYPSYPYYSGPHGWHPWYGYW
ncbi:MAG TPA: hypothetical protein VK503_01750 [Candidatus Bathyarchaeia archaeon]|nr:hypothetical protein [Candidatus Bathyarchaeia archaeon]